MRLRAPSLTSVAAFAVLAAVFLVALAPRFDPDFWWHLKDGQYIASHHSVPSRDFMSFAYAGHPWTDLEWLPELIMYELYRLAGLRGPVVFYGCIIALTFALVYWDMVQRRIQRFLALAVLICAAVASTGSWGPRIQMLTLLFLASYALVLHRFELTRDRRLLVIFPVLMLVWANSHGGFALGLAFLTLALVGECLNRRFQHIGSLSRGDLQFLGGSCVVTVAVTLVNPNGARELLYPLTFLAPNPFTNLIQESASPNFHVFIFMVFGAMQLTLIAALYFGRHAVNWTHLLLILSMTYLALEQGRNVAVWCVLISPLVALYLQQAMQRVYIEKRWAGGIKSVINVAFVVLVIGACVRAGAIILDSSSISGFVNRSFPGRAVSYMQVHRLPAHVLAEYTWGGYVLWRVFPRYQVYMDSRADTVYSATILDDYETMFQAGPSWRTELDHYHVNNVLVPPQAPLAEVLAHDSEWKLTYHDGGAVLYVRVG